jgi:hypothetical protein
VTHFLQELESTDSGQGSVQQGCAFNTRCTAARSATLTQQPGSRPAGSKARPDPPSVLSIQTESQAQSPFDSQQALDERLQVCTRPPCPGRKQTKVMHWLYDSGRELRIEDQQRAPGGEGHWHAGKCSWAIWFHSVVTA